MIKIKSVPIFLTALVSLGSLLHFFLPSEYLYFLILLPVLSVIILLIFKYRIKFIPTQNTEEVGIIFIVLIPYISIVIKSIFSVANIFDESFLLVLLYSILLSLIFTIFFPKQKISEKLSRFIIFTVFSYFFVISISQILPFSVVETKTMLISKKYTIDGFKISNRERFSLSDEKKLEVFSFKVNSETYNKYFINQRIILELRENLIKIKYWEIKNET